MNADQMVKIAICTRVNFPDGDNSGQPRVLQGRLAAHGMIAELQADIRAAREW